MNWAYEWDLAPPANGAQLISDDTHLTDPNAVPATLHARPALQCRFRHHRLRLASAAGLKDRRINNCRKMLATPASLRSVDLVAAERRQAIARGVSPWNVCENHSLAAERRHLAKVVSPLRG